MYLPMIPWHSCSEGKLTCWEVYDVTKTVSCIGNVAARCVYTQLLYKNMFTMINICWRWGHLHMVKSKYSIDKINCVSRLSWICKILCTAPILLTACILLTQVVAQFEQKSSLTDRRCIANNKQAFYFKTFDWLV